MSSAGATSRPALGFGKFDTYQWEWKFSPLFAAIGARTGWLIWKLNRSGILLLLAVVADRPKVLLHNALAGWLPERFVHAALDRLGIEPRTPLAHLPREDRRRLLNALLDWPLPVVGSRGFGHAEATAGGVPLTEIEPATLMSRRCPGLFLAGEILDVDGRIGGFNFQWAWSSAYVVAAGIARWFEGSAPEAYTPSDRPGGEPAD